LILIPIDSISSTKEHNIELSYSPSIEGKFILAYWKTRKEWYNVIAKCCWEQEDIFKTSKDAGRTIVITLSGTNISEDGATEPQPPPEEMRVYHN
jgi:hypothetical protein